MLTSTKAAKKNQSLLLSALEHSVAVLELGTDGTILYANPKYLELSGYDLQELAGKKYSFLWTVEDLLSEQYAVLEKELKQGNIKSGIIHRKKKDGSCFWLNAIYHTVFSDDDTPDKIYQICLDVSEEMKREHTRESLLEAFDRSCVMAEYAPDGTFLSVNENFMSTLGFENNEINGKRLSKVFPALKFDGQAYAEVWKYICSGHIYSQLMEWQAFDGTPVWLETSFAPMFSSNKKIERIAQISRDVTDRMAKEQEKHAMLQRLLLIMSRMRNAVVMTDNTNKVIYINSQFTEMLGYTLGDIIGKSPTCILGPAEKNFLKKTRQSLNMSGTSVCEEQITTKKGENLWVSWLSSAVFNEQGKREYVVSVIHDITDSKVHELLQEKALESMARGMATREVLNIVCHEVERIFPGMYVSVMGIDKKHEHFTFAVSCNPLLAKALNGAAGSAIDPSSLKAIQNNTVVIERNISSIGYPEKFREILISLGIRSCLLQPLKLNSGIVIGTLSFHYVDADSPNELQLRIAKIVSRICCIALERDLSRAEARRFALFDAMTGLPKRDMLIANAKQQLAFDIDSGLPSTFAVLQVNINRFHRINNLLGYEAGSQVLKLIVQRIREVKRERDLLGHLSADEFILIVHDCDTTLAEETAKRIQSVLSRPCTVNGVAVVLSARVGISLYPENGTDIATLLNEANTATAEAKECALDAICFFTPQMAEVNKDRVSLESRLQNAITQDLLNLHFQPQISIQSGRLYGVEALCRWEDEENGNISPTRFIPLAEETGLIIKLGYQVLQKACSQLAAWRKAGLEVPRVSINLSTPSFRDSKLLEKILLCLAEYGLAPGDITLELTESVLLEADEAVLGTFQKIHDSGIALSLDDFGTGYSSLSYLQKLPISEIKLDRSFVQDMHLNEVSKRLSSTIAHIGKTLNMTVLAEGIENVDQYYLLKEQDYNVGQGYLLSKPLAPKEFEGWLQQWNPSAM